MRTRQFLCVLTVLLLAACKQVEGTYYPGCAAFEGDKVVLQAGSVIWDRFTDQVIVDADGNAIDQFPEFPKTGVYEVDGDSLHLRFEQDNVAKTFHVRRRDDRVVLLNAEEFAAWERTGQIDDCVLTLAPEKVP